MSETNQKNKNFARSRLIGLLANMFGIISGLVNGQYLRCLAGVFNSSGNGFALYHDMNKNKYAGQTINTSPTEVEIAQPIRFEDCRKWISTDTMGRNIAAHVPRVLGNTTGMISGLAYDRPYEALGGFIFATINGIPLMKFEKSYQHSGKAGLVASAAYMLAGANAKDWLQFTNGALNFLYYIFHLKVENKVDIAGDQLFVKKVEDRIYKFANAPKPPTSASR